MRKSWRLLVAALALSLIAAACGSDDDPADSAGADDALAAAQAAQAEAEAAQAEAEAAQAEAEAAAADAEAALEDAGSGDDEPALPFAGEVVRITGPERSPEEWGSLQAAMDVFAEETGMTIIYTGSADWEAEINVQLAAGNPPDISIFPQPGKLADFARRRRHRAAARRRRSARSRRESGAMPASSASARSTVSSTAPPTRATSSRSSGTSRPVFEEQRLLRFPRPGMNCVALTAQADRRRQHPVVHRHRVRWQATGWVFTDWTEDLMLRFAGPDAYDQWVTNDLKFSDATVTDIFQRILDLWNTEGAVFAGGGSISTTHHSSDNAEGLAADDCAMVRQASFFSGFLPAGTSTDVDVFYFPSIDENRPVLGAGTLAGAFIDRPAVWAVMEYFGSPEYANLRQINQKEAQGGEGQLSGFNTANLNADTSLWEPLEQSFIEIMQTAAVLRFDGSDLMPADVGAGTFWTEATAMVNGEKTPAEAAAAIDASWPTE